MISLSQLFLNTSSDIFKYRMGIGEFLGAGRISQHMGGLC